MVRRRVRALALCAALVLLAACEVQATVDVVVEPDGSGVVTVGVGLSPSALAQAPNLGDELRLDDLVATGWEVTGPAVEDDGHTWVRASKPFAHPDHLGVVLAEVAGADGALRDFELTRERAFARTDYEVTGSIDLTGGLEAFGDDGLAAALDGLPLGQTVEEIEATAGLPIEEAFTFRMTIALPGGDPVVLDASLADEEPVSVAATGEVRRSETLTYAAVAVVAGLLALVLAVVVPLLRWRRRRIMRPRGRHAQVDDPLLKR